MPPYDYETLFDIILAALVAPGSITQRMHTVIDECERQLPHPDWAGLRQLDFDADTPTLKEWMSNAWMNGAVRPGDTGLWFGIFNPGNEEHDITCDMYVASGPLYDEETVDWADEVDLRDGVSYLNSTVLGEIYRIANESVDGLENDAEYPLTLSYGAMAACTALAQGALVPELSALRGAAAGFEDGDALILGVFDNLRFIPQVREA